MRVVLYCTTATCVASSSSTPEAIHVQTSSLSTDPLGRRTCFRKLLGRHELRYGRTRSRDGGSVFLHKWLQRCKLSRLSSGDIRSYLWLLLSVVVFPLNEFHCFLHLYLFLAVFSTPAELISFSPFASQVPAESGTPKW